MVADEAAKDGNIGDPCDCSQDTDQGLQELQHDARAGVFQNAFAVRHKGPF